MTKNILIAVTFLLGLTFFGFVDGKFRGWDDTNQYQLEAQAWAKGERPPVNYILQGHVSHMGPTHVAPLLPYMWSFLIDSQNDNTTLTRIKIFQALLMLFNFYGLIYLLSKKNLLSALVITSLLLLNESSRQLVSIPATEPLAFSFLIASYIWPRSVGVMVILELLVRPPMILLFIPQLWKKRKDRIAIATGTLTLVASCLFFKKLVIPSSFAGGGFGLANAINIVKHFVIDSSMYLFDHLLPYKNPLLLTLWGATLLALLLYTFYKHRKEPLTLTSAGLYFLVICIPFAQGVRYFIPLFIFLILEFKPTLPKNKWAKYALIVFATHLAIQQVDAIREFKRFPVPETQTAGLMQARNFLKGKRSVLIMGKFRYCINFFQTQCYGFTEFSKNLETAVRDLKVNYAVFTSADWMKEDQEFKEKLRNHFKEKGTPFEKRTIQLQDVTLVDLSLL